MYLNFIIDFLRFVIHLFYPERLKVILIQARQLILQVY